MLFSMKMEYALRVLFEIFNAPKGMPINRKAIAKNQHIPIHFLEKIMLSLKESYIIESVKGPKGGYILREGKENISLWDIYEALDYKDIKGIRCFPGLGKECEYLEKCKIKNIWFVFNKKFYEQLSTLRIKPLLDIAF